MEFNFEDGLTIVKSLTTNVLAALRRVPSGDVSDPQADNNQCSPHTDVDSLHRIGNFNKFRKKGLTRKRNSEKPATSSSIIDNKLAIEDSSIYTKPLLTIKLCQPAVTIQSGREYIAPPTNVADLLNKPPGRSIAPGTYGVPCASDSNFESGKSLSKKDHTCISPSKSSAPPGTPSKQRTSSHTADEVSRVSAEFDNDIKYLATVPNKTSTPAKPLHTSDTARKSSEAVICNIQGTNKLVKSFLLQISPSTSDLRQQKNESSSGISDQSSEAGILAPRLAMHSSLQRQQLDCPKNRTARRCLFMSEDEEAVYYLVTKYLSDR